MSAIIKVNRFCLFGQYHSSLGSYRRNWSSQIFSRKEKILELNLQNRREIIDRLTLLRPANYVENNRQFALMAIRTCLDKIFRRQVIGDPTLDSYSGQLVNAIEDELNNEKDVEKQPLTSILDSSRLSAKHFYLSEASFKEEMDSGFPYSKVTAQVVNFTAHPLLYSRIIPDLLPIHEKWLTLDYSDFYWRSYREGFGIPVIIEKEEDRNLENRIFNELLAKTVRSSGTLVRELAGGRCERQLTLLWNLLKDEKNPKIPSAILVSDINPSYGLIGQIALQALNLNSIFLSCGVGHYLGQFNTHSKVAYQDQVLVLSRGVTVCKGSHLWWMFWSFNKQMKIGDRLIASFATPNGRLYSHYLEANKLGKNKREFMKEVRGEVFVEEFEFAERDKQTITKMFAPHSLAEKNNFHVVLHNFIAYRDMENFGQRMGFDIEDRFSLFQQKFPELLDNDREIVVFKKTGNLETQV